MIDLANLLLGIVFGAIMMFGLLHMANLWIVITIIPALITIGISMSKLIDYSNTKEA